MSAIKSVRLIEKLFDIKSKKTSGAKDDSSFCRFYKGLRLRHSNCFYESQVEQTIG